MVVQLTSFKTDADVYESRGMNKKFMTANFQHRFKGKSSKSCNAFSSLFLTLIILLISTVNILGQSSIHGSVLDENGKAMANANVLLLNAKDSVLIKGMITSDKGIYSFINNAKGNFIVTSTFTGYKQVYTLPFTNDNNDTDLKTISLTQTDKQLKTVTVITKKPFIEQRIDRMVINVKNSITSAGSTALEVLERSPGVMVDRQNNNISMGGKNGVVVMINGKINHMPMDALVQMLAGMNSANIEKIELITTPPANFDAEGNAGFINIVLVNNTAFGTNGSYSATIGYGKGETTLTSLNFNQREGKINISGDLSFSRIRVNQIFTFYRLVNYNGKIIESNSINDRNTLQRNYTGRLGFDFQASKKTLIGTEISSYDNRWSMDANNNNTISINNKPDTLVNIVDAEINRWTKYGASLNIQHTINENEKINFEYDYDHYLDNNPNYYQNTFLNGSGNFLYDQNLNSEKSTPIVINVVSADYSKKISKNVDLNTGFKFSTYRFTNDVAVSRYFQNQWTTDKEFTAKYFLKEDIPAVFAALTITLNEKNSIKTGLRYEHTTSNLETLDIKNIVDRKYGKLFPSFFYSHKINDHNSINFSYSKRITRPTFRDLAPFVYFIDPNTFISGNSALQPAISNSADIGYTYKRFLFSVSYSEEDNFIASFQSRVDAATNKQYLIAENYPKLKTAGITLSLPFTIAKWWNMQNNFNASWQQVNAVYNTVPLKLESENYNFSSTQTFTLPANFSFELQGFYASAQLAGTYILKSLGALNLGIQKKLSGQKGKLSFNVKDIFNSMVGRISVNLPAQNLVTRGSFNFSNRTYSITYSKSFGSNEIKANRNKSAASEEERKRVE